LWDRVDLKGLGITSLIVPFRLYSSNPQSASKDTDCLGGLENNKGSHEVPVKLKPASIDLEFIE
jgi:hypothetical protein